MVADCDGAGTRYAGAMACRLTATGHRQRRDDCNLVAEAAGDTGGLAEPQYSQAPHDAALSRQNL